VSGQSRGRWRRASAAGAIAALLFALGLGLRLGGFTGMATAANILAVPPLMVQMVRWAREKQDPPGRPGPRQAVPSAAPPPAVMDNLCDAAVRHLLGHEGSRNDRFGLPVRWQTADSSLAGEWAGLMQPGRQEPGLPEASTRRNRLAEAFRQIPGRRLVILGRPGSGKTTAAKLLALQLLQEYRDSAQVPVPFRVDTWNPYDWRLVEFLEYTHRAEILRYAGASYEFRTEALRIDLAEAWSRRPRRSIFELAAEAVWNLPAQDLTAELPESHRGR
jgi:hypothetical protein